MGFIKLPSNSEKILLALAQSDNPTQTLSGIYEGASSKTRRELDGIVKELKEYGWRFKKRDEKGKKREETPIIKTNEQKPLVDIFDD